VRELEIDQSHAPNFRLFRGDKTLFVETGTNFGNGVFTALNCGFERAISVEILQDLYDENVEKYAGYDNVTLFLGDSAERLPQMLQMVDEPAFFWIDAHHGNGDPAFTELKILKDHHIKTHTIMVDDMKCHFNDLLGKEIERLLLEINPEYTLQYVDNLFHKNYILVATAPNKEQA
jgi:hypothetical protein